METRLSLVFDAGRLSVQKFVELTSTNPAKLYGLYPQKGSIMPGISDADLVIWYPEGSLDGFELTNTNLHHDVDYTPYEGRKLSQWPRWTVLRGQVVWDRDNGGLLGQKGFGRFVKRGASSLAGSCQPGDWDVARF